MIADNHGALNEELLLVPCLITMDSKELLIGINAQKIMGIVEYGGISSLPSSHFPFIGLLDNHEEAVPVMDLSMILNDPALDLANKSEIIAAETAQSSGVLPSNYQIQKNGHDKTKIVICELCGLVVGILVNATFRIESLKSSQILHIPKIFENYAKCMFTGLFYYRNSFLYLLDLEGILNRLGLLNPEEINENNHTVKYSELAGKSILIVEDSKVFRHQITKLLEENGMNCIVANDGQEGLEKFKATPDKIDLIITDIEMPRMNGIEMARKIHEECKTIPILFSSSISNPALIAEIKAEHGYFLVKFQPQEVLNQLRHMLS